jgi:hypothetical protein
MAVDIEYRLSGGAANSNPLASTGGAMSSVEAVGATLFDTVSSVEAADGDIEYRCVYVTNNGATTATGAKVWVQANTPSADTTIAIALDGNGKNATAETESDESTAPTGESFSSPTGIGDGLSLGDLAAADYYGVWIRRTVTAAAAGVASDTFTLRVGYDYIPD